MKKIFLSLLFIFAMMFIASCYTPSPLYGTWSDNSGNKITFISDGTFVAICKLRGRFFHNRQCIDFFLPGGRCLPFNEYGMGHKRFDALLHMVIRRQSNRKAHFVSYGKIGKKDE